VQATEREAKRKDGKGIEGNGGKVGEMSGREATRGEKRE